MQKKPKNKNKNKKQRKTKLNKTKLKTNLIFMRWKEKLVIIYITVLGGMEQEKVCNKNGQGQTMIL